MRRNALTIVAAALLAWLPVHAFAQNPRAQQPTAPAPAAAAAPAENAAVMAARMKQLLAEWEKQSARLQTLDLKIKRTDKAKAWDVDELYKGRAILKAPNYAFLHFDKVVNEKGREKLVPHEQIRCTGNEVWHYKFDVKQIFVFPLDREARKRALEEGPLPFLFNMKAAEAEARYTMRLLREDAKSYIIGVEPKLAIDKESFSKAYVQLDRTYLLPTRIYQIHPNGTDSRDYELFDIKPQAKVNDGNFQGQEVKGWQLTRNPGGDVPQNRAAPNVRQPALRNGAQPGRR